MRPALGYGVPAVPVVIALAKSSADKPLSEGSAVRYRMDEHWEEGVIVAAIPGLRTYMVETRYGVKAMDYDRIRS